ncbi:MAG: PAS domain S-box protein, partial [Bacteroidales bacterium]|nr:PAS domain S-box protein [Bacteroidales bacterium]
MSLKKLKILFVEDLPADAEIAMREIRKEKIGFDVMVVDSATTFREALTEFEPDLIISDYAMPVFDGMTALNITRSQPHYIPFIMLTGSINEETAVACLKAGADDYVLKERIKRLPFAVREVLRKADQKRENELIVQKLKETEEKFETYVTSSPTAVFTVNKSGTYTFVNPAANTLLGYTKEELMQMNISQIAHPDNLKDNLDAFPRLLQGERVHQEISMLTKNEEKIFVILDAVMLDEDTIIGFCTETTERKKAEEALATSEETYRNLFQNAQVGLFRTRITDGKILEGNDQIARMFGYGSREEFIAEYTTSGNYVDPGTRERMLEEITERGFIENFEARFTRKDHTIFHASYSARIYPDKGWIEGVVEDISEQKQAQMALQVASENWKITFRSMKDGIALLDADQHILQSNEAFQEFVGKTEEELKQGRCFEYIHGTDCPI